MPYNFFCTNIKFYLGTHQTCKANGQGNDYIKKGDAKDCEFPFIHKNKKYIGCATSEDLKVHYCATKLDSKGNMVEWARCNKFCKTDAERKCSVFIIIKFFPLFMIHKNL